MRQTRPISSASANSVKLGLHDNSPVYSQIF